MTDLPPTRHQMPGGRRRALVGGWLGVVLGLAVHLLTRRGPPAGPRP